VRDNRITFYKDTPRNARVPGRIGAIMPILHGVILPGEVGGSIDRVRIAYPLFARIVLACDLGLFVLLLWTVLVALANALHGSATTTPWTSLISIILFLGVGSLTFIYDFWRTRDEGAFVLNNVRRLLRASSASPTSSKAASGN
jgi:hypothetical protein